MYKGEVLVPEEQLGSFCQTAVSLKIKGNVINVTCMCALLYY